MSWGTVIISNLCFTPLLSWINEVPINIFGTVQIIHSSHIPLSWGAIFSMLPWISMKFHLTSFELFTLFTLPIWDCHGVPFIFQSVQNFYCSLVFPLLYFSGYKLDSFKSFIVSSFFSPDYFKYIFFLKSTNLSYNCHIFFHIILLFNHLIINYIVLS